MKLIIQSALRKGVELVIGTALTGGVSVLGMDYLNNKQQQQLITEYRKSDQEFFDEIEKLKKQLSDLKKEVKKV
jgi:hydrogenase maturation factor HypE